MLHFSISHDLDEFTAFKMEKLRVLRRCMRLNLQWCNYHRGRGDNCIFDFCHDYVEYLYLTIITTWLTSLYTRL